MADTTTPMIARRTPRNKGRLIGQKPPLKLREVWAVRTRPQMAGNTRELALVNLAIGSKLRGCGLFRRMVRDVAHGSSGPLAGHHRTAEDHATGAVRPTKPGRPSPRGSPRRS